MGSKFKLIGSKNSHDGSVRCLYYNSDSSILYSGGFDKSIIVIYIISINLIIYLVMEGQPVLLIYLA